jgi:soluble lytic murein transglycosylase
MELAARTAPPNVALRAAKIALLRGFAVEAYAYPALLPKFSEAGGNAKIELALLNALTRQESEFYTGDVSRVGARGLMQLMPQTAKQVAAAYKMKYEMGRLVSDPSYNVTLGSAFLAQLLSGYDGSYILALVAYNAGPGRVAEWIKEFGDPRDKSIDPIDWIEQIPFAETRDYVQKIMESTQVYRCRLEEGRTHFQLVEDLHRGRPGKVPDLSDVAGSAGLDETP